jgi:predicted RNA-binding protein YlqC (UPF0109 family)
MIQERSYLRVADEVPTLLNNTDVNKAVLLIESSIGLITDTPLDQVIESLTIESKSGKGIEVQVAIHPRWRPLVFGKKFSNVVALRKLVSNLSGKAETEVWLSVVER